MANDHRSALEIAEAFFDHGVDDNGRAQIVIDQIDETFCASLIERVGLPAYAHKMHANSQFKLAYCLAHAQIVCEERRRPSIGNDLETLERIRKAASELKNDLSGLSERVRHYVLSPLHSGGCITRNAHNELVNYDGFPTADGLDAVLTYFSELTSCEYDLRNRRNYDASVSRCIVDTFAPVYASIFDREPATTTTGPFVRFVQFVFSRTDAEPDFPSPHSISAAIKAHRAEGQRTRDDADTCKTSTDT